jgi:hypothetical protein
MEKLRGYWFRAAARAIVTRSVYRDMEQEPQKKKNANVPDPPATPDPQAATEEPVQVIRPEDEAIVVERLRELGYID